MAVGVHVGNGNPQHELVSQYNGGGSFWKFRIPVIGACHPVMMSEVPQHIPKLRFHWAEAAAQWIPYVVKKDLQRRWGAIGKAIPMYPLKEYRQFVSCQTDDDVDYILKYSGEDNITIDQTFTDTTTNPRRSKRCVFSRLKALLAKVNTTRSLYAIRRRFFAL